MYAEILVNQDENFKFVTPQSLPVEVPVVASEQCVEVEVEPVVEEPVQPPERSNAQGLSWFDGTSWGTKW